MSCFGCYIEYNVECVFIGFEFCSVCYGEFSLKSDLIFLSYVDLIVVKDWNFCLICYDFYGNYVYCIFICIFECFDVEVIRFDFFSGLSFYGSEKIFEGKSE